MAEWFKAPGRGPGISGCASSNLAGVITFLYHTITFNFFLLQALSPSLGFFLFYFIFFRYNIVFKSEINCT